MDIARHNFPNSLKLATNTKGRQKGARDKRTKVSLQDKVYTELRHSLMVGRFLPGESITLRNLAAELGVSPMPVRGAVRHLIAEGGFEMLPNRSVRVPHMTRDRFNELLSVRWELEGMITEMACRRMTDAEFREIKALHRNNARALKLRDEALIRSINQQFHFAIYSVAHSWVLMPIIEALWLRAGPFLHLAQVSPGIKWDGRHHNDLMQALSRRDAKVARRAIQRDITMVGQNLRKMPLLRD